MVGYALAPDRIADQYGWVHGRWYQREIGASNAGLGDGGLMLMRAGR